MGWKQIVYKTILGTGAAVGITVPAVSASKFAIESNELKVKNKALEDEKKNLEKQIESIKQTSNNQNSIETSGGERNIDYKAKFENEEQLRKKAEEEAKQAKLMYTAKTSQNKKYEDRKYWARRILDDIDRGYVRDRSKRFYSYQNVDAFRELYWYYCYDSGENMPYLCNDWYKTKSNSDWVAWAKQNKG